MTLLSEKDAIQVRDTFDLLGEDEKPLASRWMRQYAEQQEEFGMPLYPSEEAKAQESRTAFQSLFQGLDKVKAEISPVSDNPDRDRAIHANIPFLAERFKVPAQEIADRPNFYRNEYARQRFGIPGGVDDVTFYKHAAKEVNDQAEAEKARRHGREEGARAALSDQGSLSMLSTMASDAMENPQSEALNKAKIEAYREVSDILAPFRHEIKSTGAAVERLMTGAGRDGDEEAVEAAQERLLDLPGKQRRFVIAALLEQGKQAGKLNAAEKSGRPGIPFGGLGAVRGFVQQIGESAYRFGASGMSTSQDMELAIQQVADSGEVRFSAPAITTPEEARKYVRESIIQGMSNRASLEGGGPGMAPMMPMDSRPVLTLDQKAQDLIKDAKARASKGVRVRQEFEQIANSTDPVTNIFASAIGTSVAAVGLMGATRGLAGPVLARAYSNIEYDQLSLQYPSMSVSDKAMVSTLSGGIQAALDYAGFKVLDKLPGLKSLIGQPMTGVLAGRAAARLGLSYLQENIIEGGQDAATSLLMAALKSDVPGYDWDREMKEFWGGRADVALGTLPLILLGGGMASVKEYTGAKELLSRFEKIKEAGVQESAALEVVELAQAGKLEEAQARLQAAWGERDPKVAAAGQAEAASRTKSEAAAAAVLERMAFIEGNPLPTISHDSTGWTITDPQTGEAVTFKTAEEAKEIAGQRMIELERQQFSLIATLTEDFMAGRPPELSEETTTLSQGTPDTLRGRVASGEITPQQAMEAAAAAGILTGQTAADARAIAETVFGGSTEDQRINEIRDLINSIAVMGSNRVEGGVSKSKVQFEGNRMPFLTKIEETIEGRWKAFVKAGRFTKAQGLAFVAAAEQATGLKFLEGMTAEEITASAEANPRALIEAISRIVTADVLGIMRGRQRVAPGSISGRLDLSKPDQSALAAILGAFRRFFKNVLQASKKLMQARKQGKLGAEYETLFNSLTGTSEQVLHETEAIKEAEAIANEAEYAGGESWSEENPGPNGETFSLASRQFLPGQYPDSLAKTITSTTVGKLTSHPQYQDAKKDGDGAAALAVVNDVLKASKVDELAALVAGQEVTWVPVMHLDTGTRANALPMAYADELAHRLGGRVADDIVKITGAANTGVGVQDRFLNEQSFDGPVVKGGLYVVVDDNHTSGDTLAALIDHIHAGGGQVIAATALANSQSQNYLKARPADLAKLLDKAGLDEASFAREFGYSVEAFTGSEAYRLANLDRGEGIDWLRGRIPSKRSEANQGRSADGASEASELTFSLAVLRAGGFPWKPGARVQMGNVKATVYSVQANREGAGWWVVFDDVERALSTTIREPMEAFAKLVDRYTTDIKTVRHGDASAILRPRPAVDALKQDERGEAKARPIPGAGEIQDSGVRYQQRKLGPSADSIKVGDWLNYDGPRKVTAIEPTRTGERWISFGKASILFSNNARLERVHPPAEETHSLRAGDFQSRMEAAFSPFQKSPEMRLAVAQVAKQRALKLGAEWIEKAAALRSVASIGKESRMREALAYEARMNEYLDRLTPEARQALEWEPSALADDPLISAMLDHGKLMSRTTALQLDKLTLKNGDYDGAPWLPPSWYSKGAGIMPDQMAQAMHDAHLLPDAHTDTLWQALAQRIEASRKDKAAYHEAQTAYKAAVKYARDASRAEVDHWAEGARKEAGSPAAQRAMLKAALRTLDGILAAAPPEVRARVGGYVKLAGLATDEKMLQEIESRIEKLNVELEKWLRKEGVVQIEKLLKKGRPDSEAGKKAKGKDADMHHLFAAAARAAEMDETAVAGELARLDALIDGGTLTAEQEVLATTERGLVELIGDLYPRTAATGKPGKNGQPIYERIFAGAESARIFAAIDALQEIYDGAWLRWKLKEIERRERRAGLRQDLITDTGKSGVATERDAADAQAATLLGKVKGGFLSLSSFHEVLSYAFGEKSERVTALVDSERTASGQYEDAGQVLADDIEGLFTTMAGGSVLAGEKLRFQMAQKTIQTSKASLSQLEAITALLMWRQEQGRQHMEGLRNENGDVISTWAYDQAWIDEINAALTPDARRVMGWLVGRYAAEYGTLNPLYRERYGVNLPGHDNYSPITVAPQQTKAGEVVDPVSGAAISSGSVLTPSSLRTRARNVVAEPLFKDALQVFVAHNRQIEYWKAYFDLATEANAILGNREVLNAVHAKGGPEAAAALRKWVDAIAQGGFRDAAATLAVNTWIRQMSSNAATVALLGRVSTLLVQSTQLAAAAVQMPVGAYLSRFSKLLTGRLGWGDAIRSDFIQRRYQSAPPIVRQAMEGLANAKKPNIIKSWANALGKLLSGADAAFTAGTYAMLLDYHRGTGRALGYTGAELERWAYTEAERATEQVAQPTRMATRSLAEITNTNPLGKVSWAFASESRQKIVLMAWATGNIREDPARFTKTLFLVFGVGGLMSQVLKNLWREAKGDDDEEKWSPQRLAMAAVVQPFQGIPGVSQLMGESGMLTTPRGAAAALDDLMQGKGDMKDVETLMSAAGYFNDTAAGVASLSHLGFDFARLLSNLADED